MNLRKIEYNVDIKGITPSNESFGGTQGDHRVTKIMFTISETLYTAITSAVASATNGKAMYRFDVYDGEGGVWSSEASVLSEDTVSIELEERHTRYGGKITVYLVISVLSDTNETEVELFNFPAILQLKNRPEGICQNGENYESMTGLAEKTAASEAAATASKNYAKAMASTAEEYAQDAAASASKAASTLTNIKTAISDSTDKTYNAESENAQSGKAIAEVLDGYVKKEKGNGHTHQVYAVGTVDGVYNDCVLNVEDNDRFEAGAEYGAIPCRQSNGNLMTNEPIKMLDCVNKKYVDDISSTKQDALVSGTNIKTINGESIIGSGDITVKTGSSESITVDQTYNPTSENAQSGKAVAEAISGKADNEIMSLNSTYFLNVRQTLLADNVYFGVLTNISPFSGIAGGQLVFDFGSITSVNPNFASIANLGYEVGKRYRVTIDNAYITDISLVTTLEDKANVTDTVPVIINYDGTFRKAVYAQTAYRGSPDSSEVTAIICDRDDGYMTHVYDEGALFDNFEEFANSVALRHSNGNLLSGLPQGRNEVANKNYVDTIVGDIETLLGGI